MDSAIIWLLGASTVAAVALWVTKSLLDQIPDLAQSWRRARRALRSEGRSGSDSDQS